MFEALTFSIWSHAFYFVQLVDAKRNVIYIDILLKIKP